jgi:hypothetical protein
VEEGNARKDGERRERGNIKYLPNVRERLKMSHTKVAYSFSPVTETSLAV